MRIKRQSFFKLRCPRCNGTYWYQGEDRGWETCPYGCGYNADFKEFVVSQVKDNKEKLEKE